MSLGKEYPIKLVHGVFGSGKSFTLAMIVMLFSSARTKHLLPSTFRIIVASLTNCMLICLNVTIVAVDRVLLILSSLEFCDFVRVGTTKKIHPDLFRFTFKSQKNEQTESNESQCTITKWKGKQDVLNAFLIGIQTFIFS